MPSIRTTLVKAAEHLDSLDLAHLPTDLVAHTQDIRGRVTERGSHEPVAQAFYGGLAEVIIALGPAMPPLLGALLRRVANESPDDERHDMCSADSCLSVAALAVAEHILKANEEV